ncbi:putative carboxymethylenebutenolidase [Nitrospira sp.]|nr:putative carboxymethylenebutenolidase [Nitrospira sp.]
MSDLNERMVEFSSDGIAVTAYLVTPTGARPRPAIIVIQEWWGLNEHIKDIARRYAREGFVTIAPDLYSRLGHPVTTNSQDASRLMQTLQQQDGLKDVAATLAYLKTRPEVDSTYIGITGFCMGGTYALLFPCVNSGLKAAVPFYGQIPDPDTPIRTLSCPILFIQGEDDTWITTAEVQRLADALSKYRKPGEIKTYQGAAHAFFNDTRKDVYRENQAHDAWARAVSFFKQHLHA